MSQEHPIQGRHQAPSNGASDGRARRRSDLQPGDPEEPQSQPQPNARRSALGMLGASLAASSLLSPGGAAAQTPAVRTPARARPSLVDPRNGFPKPPFEPQQQAWPGLARLMQPRPDHGETSYVGSGRLAGRRALLTGGDSGIGRAAAIAFAREGADVAINYLPAEEDDAREVIQLILAEGRRAAALPGDLRSESFCRTLVESAAKALGGLDIIVNNAARQRAQKVITDITNEQFDDTLKTNLYAMFWITKAAVPLLPAGATIINTASEVAYNPPATLLDYATTKAGIVGFTKALAKQLTDKGIRVNAVAPGPFWTPLQPSGGQLPDKLPQFGADTPMGRPGQPAEIAPLYVQLAASDSTFVTGNVFGSTGGNAGP